MVWRPNETKENELGWDVKPRRDYSDHLYVNGHRREQSTSFWVAISCMEFADVSATYEMTDVVCSLLWLACMIHVYTQLPIRVATS